MRRFLLVLFSHVMTVFHSVAKAHQSHKPKDRHLRRLSGNDKNNNKSSIVTSDGDTFKNFDEYKHSRSFRKPGRKCTTPEPTKDQVQQSNNVAQRWREAHPCDGPGAALGSPHCKDENGRRYLQQVTPIEIQVKWFAIRPNHGTAEVTEKMISDTMSVINQAYYPDFQFKIDMTSDVIFIDKSAWYPLGYGSPSERNLKETHRHSDDCKTLNVYSSKLDEGLLGWATLPEDCTGASLADDGVVINEGALYGGSFDNLNLGHTLTHEIGHWLGLYHTFWGGCHTEGDFVDDTPAQKYAVFGCDVHSDTCNGGGKDPVHNYMGYSDDDCMSEFTDMQRIRMHSQWEAYRDVPPGPPTVAPVELTCGEGEVVFEAVIETDHYGEETSWELRDICGGNSLVHSGGDYDSVSRYLIEECVLESKYTFTIYDEFEDGMCCEYGNGYYQVKYDGVKYRMGGKYGKEESTTFGMCGDSKSTPSSADATSYPSQSPSLPSSKVVIENNFNNGWGQGCMPADKNNANGAKVVKNTGNNGSGVYIGAQRWRKEEGSAFIKGRKGWSSGIKTESFSIVGYQWAEVSFDARISGTKNQKNNLFWLQYCYDDCPDTSWVNSKFWRAGLDFSDGQDWKHIVQSIDIEEGHEYMAIRLRNLPIRATATVFLDDLKVVLNRS